MIARHPSTTVSSTAAVYAPASKHAPSPGVGWFYGAKRLSTMTASGPENDLRSSSRRAPAALIAATADRFAAGSGDGLVPIFENAAEPIWHHEQLLRIGESRFTPH